MSFLVLVLPLNMANAFFHPHFSPAQMLKRVREIDSILGFKPPATPRDKALLLEEQGMMLNALGRLEEAMVAFEKAIMLCPSDPRLYYSYASMLISKDLVREAIPLLEKSVKLAPREITFISLMAQALEKAREWKKSAETWVKAAKLEKDNLLSSEHYGSAARVECAAGNLEKAIFFLDKALELSNRAPQWIYEKAKVLIRQGKFQEGANELLEAVKASNGEEGDEFAWLIEAGEAFQKAGLGEKARKAFKKAIEMIDGLLKEDPAFAEDLYFHKAKALSGLGKPREAAKSLLKALEILPGEPPYLALGLKVFSEAGMKEDLEKCKEAIKAEEEKERQLVKEEKKSKERRMKKYRAQFERGKKLWEAWKKILSGKDPGKEILELQAWGKVGERLTARVKAEWYLKTRKYDQLLRYLEKLPKWERDSEPWIAILKLKALKALGRGNKASKEKELIRMYLESAGR